MTLRDLFYFAAIVGFGAFEFALGLWMGRRRRPGIVLSFEMRDVNSGLPLVARTIRGRDNLSLSESLGWPVSACTIGYLRPEDLRVQVKAGHDGV